MFLDMLCHKIYTFSEFLFGYYFQDPCYSYLEKKVTYKSRDIIIYDESCT